jgi:hypothetical protein
MSVKNDEILRCKECNKKISFLHKLTCTCRCKEVFCNLHRVNHICSFDYKEDYKNNNKLVKVVADKMATS